MHLRFIIVLLALILLSPGAWAFNPKVKTIGLNAVYGSVGGALLGVSSLAFGAKGRVVAKGASLGLYFGLAFGVYVVMTHGQHYLYDGYDGGGAHVPNNNLYEEGGGGWFRLENESIEINNHRHPLKGISDKPDFYLNFFQYQF